MSTHTRFPWLIGLALLAGGCMSASQTARGYAVSELRCSPARISVAEVARGTLRATGCGRTAYYLDYSALEATVTPGQPTWQLASATRHGGD